MTLLLRPLRDDELPLLDRSHHPDVDVWNRFGWSRADAASGAFTDVRGLLVVEVDGAFAGSVSWHITRYGPPVAGTEAYDVGITLLPEHRGQGHGSAAQRLLADYLFATYPAHRVEASTDVENVAEQRALEKAGFRREGVLRGAQWRAGEWHDLVVYARLRTD